MFTFRVKFTFMYKFCIQLRMRFAISKNMKILEQILNNFLQTKNNNFKSFRFFAKSMLMIIGKVTPDILMQNEIEFIIRARKI